MKVQCRTNLDLDHEKWPDDLPALPNIGDYIQSSIKWGVFQLELEVCSIMWKKSNESPLHLRYWYPVIELHIPKVHNFTLTDFYKWYAPKVGRTVGSFI